MKQALSSGARGNVEEHARRVVPYPPALLATAVLMAAAFVIVVIALYRADALLIVPTTSPIPSVLVDPSFYLPEITSLMPLPADGNLPVPQAW
jgi:hypothetical protein